ncbi:MAG: hypothetical protein A3F11_05855 [Gammaproteobacteria bacterium RIFCSPHIGHO2_12_FULL_37_14]|nr:MAG: hypothetical protein A3F11_05855 [Gammaproteobacteria bacterium RIFCSPHIGHO2_12_FULL_37_14]
MKIFSPSRRDSLYFKKTPMLWADIIFAYIIILVSYNIFGFQVSILLSILLLIQSYTIGSAENNSFLFQINSNLVKTLDSIDSKLEVIHETLTAINDNLEKADDESLDDNL